MAAPRKTRIGETLRAELSDIIRREMRDPRLTAGLLTVTDVDVTNDLKIATVYISVLGDQKVQDDALKALRGAGGLLRAELGRTKAFKSVPELHFKYDVSVERGARMFNLLEEAARYDKEHPVKPASEDVEATSVDDGEAVSASS